MHLGSVKFAAKSTTIHEWTKIADTAVTDILPLCGVAISSICAQLSRRGLTSRSSPCLVRGKLIYHRGPEDENDLVRPA